MNLVCEKTSKMRILIKNNKKPSDFLCYFTLQSVKLHCLKMGQKIEKRQKNIFFGQKNGQFSKNNVEIYIVFF